MFYSRLVIREFEILDRLARLVQKNLMTRYSGSEQFGRDKIREKALIARVRVARIGKVKTGQGVLKD